MGMSIHRRINHRQIIIGSFECGNDTIQTILVRKVFGLCWSYQFAFAQLAAQTCGGIGEKRKYLHQSTYDEGKLC
jgi:hypothetical protein